MSREERRAYKRMTKNVDPYALPSRAGTRGRPDRSDRSGRSDRSPRAAAGTRRASQTAAGDLPFVTGRFLLWTIGGAAVIGLVAFSVSWPVMPRSAYIGLAAAAAWVALVIGFRFIQRRQSVRA